MSRITAELVKELRERTGVGMMECKRALEETGGDIEAAIEDMRKKGQAKAVKRSARTASEGVVATAIKNQSAAIVELNCETDFVGREQVFKDFATEIAEKALEKKIDSIEELAQAQLADGMTIEETRQVLGSKTGENIQLRRVALITDAEHLGSYIHGGKIGVLVQVQGGTPDLAKDLALHIAASQPKAISPEEVSQDILAKEREVFMAQAQASGKPAAILEKMVEGQMSKFLNEICLLGQPFVKNPELTVGQYLKQSQAKVIKFIRFAVGEGIERPVEDFVKTVMDQVKEASGGPAAV